MSLSEAPTAISLLIVIAVSLSVGAFIVQEIQDNDIVVDNSTTHEITNSSLNALLDFGNFQGIIAIAIVAAIVLGLIAFLRT